MKQRFAQLGLPQFDYKKTGWYQTIRAENQNYTFSLVRNAIIAILIIKSCLLALAFSSGDTEALVYYSVCFAVFAVLLVLELLFRDNPLVMYACLTIPLVGFLAALRLPRGRETILLVFSAYPILCIQLRGPAKGSVWVGGFLFAFVTAYALQRYGFLSAWKISMTNIDALVFVSATGIVSCFSLLSGIRTEKIISTLCNGFVFDEATGLPGKDVLLHSLGADKRYLFAIIKIENYSDLVALFGYEFSDIISQFASRKLVKHEQRFGYKTYQLKYNEYGLLFATERALETAEAAQRLSDVVKSLEIEQLPWERDRINLVYRIGAAVVAPGNTESLLSKADVALKKAERAYSPIMIFENDNNERESAYEHVMKFSELIANRENDSFRAVFQPIFNGTGTDIAWYEALLRIRHGDGSYSSIYPYLSVAKSTGFYRYLTEFVVRKTAEAICLYDVDISVNISVHDIVRPDFIQLVDEVYEKIKHMNGRIIFEILESDELVELDKCVWFIDYISRYGFKIAIDDFGTGYSNYCSLINLPIDIVKIDGSLIKKIRHDENAKILVEGIVNFCEKANKKTVAEYVEDKAVLDSLKTMKIDFLQGYYLAKPDRINAVAESLIFRGTATAPLL